VPALASVAKSQIRSALGVSEPYSSDIRAGKRIPHPRHWETLAQLVAGSKTFVTTNSLSRVKLDNLKFTEGTFPKNS